MEKSLLMIVSIVFVVGFVGFLTVMPRTEVSTSETTSESDGLTGNVILAQPPASDACASCNGDPVCAVKDIKAYNYPSACAAHCDNAKVIFDDLCERIPRANK
jgi:hypothetical protein